MSEGIQRTYLFTKMVGAESEQDFKDLTNEIVEYISEKEARIARLERGLIASQNDGDWHGGEWCQSNSSIELGFEVLGETEQQSLASIEAEAVETAAKNLCLFRGHLYNVVSYDQLVEYASQLRQQADKQ